jgi:predicted  nucleic acid-binding Zn-ribbon protein
LIDRKSGKEDEPMFNKNILVITLLLGVFLLTASYTALAQVEVSDIPPGHWAYEAVATLLEKGYMPIGEDKLFNGEDPVDRYTLASVVAKILNEVESGRVQATSQDQQTLRLLIDELREDLIKYYTQCQNLEGNVIQAHEEIQAYGEKLSRVMLDIKDIYQKTLSLEAELSQMEQDQVDALKINVNDLNNDINDLKNRLMVIAKDLETDMKTLQEQINLLQEAEINNLQDEVENLSELLDQRDSELREDILQMREDMINISNAIIIRLTEESTDIWGQLDSQAQSLLTNLSNLEDEVYSKIDPLINELDLRLLEVQNELVIKDAYISTLKNDLYDQVNTLQHRLDQLSFSLNERIDNELIKVQLLQKDLDGYKLQLQQLNEDMNKWTDILAKADGNLLNELEYLRNKQEALETAIKRLEADVLEIKSTVGLSEDYVDQMANTIWNEILLQHGDLTDVYSRNQQLSNQIKNLTDDFNAYKLTTDQEIKSLKTTSALSIGALVLSIIGLIL